MTEFSKIITEVYTELTSEKVFKVELQNCLLTDIQDFVSIGINVIKFFYRRCTTIDNRIFIDAIIEAITHILFTSNNGQIYKLFYKMFENDNKEDL